MRKGLNNVWSNLRTWLHSERDCRRVVLVTTAFFKRHEWSSKVLQITGRISSWLDCMIRGSLTSRSIWAVALRRISSEFVSTQWRERWRASIDRFALGSRFHPNFHFTIMSPWKKVASEERQSLNSAVAMWCEVNAGNSNIQTTFQMVCSFTRTNNDARFGLQNLLFTWMPSGFHSYHGC